MTRPRLQLHLSTLVIVTVLAAGLVWLNVRQRQGRFELHEGWFVLRLERGFPYAFQIVDDDPGIHFEESWNPTMLALDLTVCLLSLAVAAAAIEWYTRVMKRGAP
jgi:hypothetical protein